MVVNSTSRMHQRFRDMNAVNLPLPETLAYSVHEFASDKLGIHPTAHIIKDLRFEYKDEENRYGWGIYKPKRLSITANEAHFKNQKKTYELTLTDFLPSYWSLYAHTFDEK